MTQPQLTGPQGNGPDSQPPRRKVVALGGGHGLHASLSALLLLDVDITAVVTVADDGGSSGRIRRELDVLPPGDLRMALAALTDAPLVPRTHGVSWAELLQHRLGGSGALAGHPIGNVLLTGLFDLGLAPVDALDTLAAMIGARGRVLPMSAVPLDLVAEVGSADRDDPVRTRYIRGQSAIASTPGRVRQVRLVPEDPPACAAAVAAIAAADLVLLGPGSWFTSVLPHLLVPELAQALIATSAPISVILNLQPQPGETDGFSPVDYLGVLLAHCPRLRIGSVIADSEVMSGDDGLVDFTVRLGSRLVVAPVAVSSGVARHDAHKLSRAIDDTW